MQNPSGCFLVLEGADGSGKTTQFKLLKARLEAVGHEVEVFDFPRYEEESSYFVRQYLSGAYGDAAKLSPYTASIFYALDRYAAAEDIRKALASGKVVMADRFVGSNMAHQGSKFAIEAEQRGFFVWEDNLEFELLGIPRPNANLFLRVPANISQKLLKERAKKSGTKLDEHERNVGHLQKSVQTYELLCQLFPNDFKLIECTADDKLLSIPQISDRIWQVVQPYLPAKPAKPARPMTVRLNEPAQTMPSEAPAKPKKGELELELSRASLLEAAAVGLPVEAPASWTKSDYAYYTPSDLPKKTLAKYKEFMDSLANLHKDMRSKAKKTKLDFAALEAAVPLAGLGKIKMPLEAGQAVTAVAKLTHAGSHAALQAADEIAKAGKKLWPQEFKQIPSAPKATEPEPINKIIARLSGNLPQANGTKAVPVELIEVWPKNEFKALVDAIYPRSRLTRPELEAQIDDWNYAQKAEALESALKVGDEQTLGQFRYLLDIVCDRLTLLEVIASQIGEPKIQPATPRYGYEVPAAIEEAGIADEYTDCFDKSLELFSSLQAAGRDDLAPYATLMGHKNRFEIVCSLGSLKPVLKAKKSPEFEKLLTEIIERVGEHHAIAVSVLEDKKLQTPAKKTEAAKKPTRRSSHKPKR